MSATTAKSSRVPKADAGKPKKRKRLVRRALRVSERASMFARLAQANPKPETELRYVNDYTLAVAVILSAQATDVGVNAATASLFRRVQTPQSMLALGETGLRGYIKTIGLYRNKARYIIAMSAMLLERYGGKLPDTRAALMGLPGIGRKTANVILNVIYGEATFAVDTHVFRLSNRTGLALGATPKAVEAKLDKVVPEPYRLYAHHWLILHGRYVCVARRPKCPQCVIQDICQFSAKEGI